MSKLSETIQFLAEASDVSADNFLLSRLDRHDRLRKQLHAILDQLIDNGVELRLVEIKRELARLGLRRRAETP